MEIKSISGRTLYVSTRTTLKEAVTEAVAAGANLDGANLRYADLHGADLHDADLRGADLEGADLHDANLHGANLHDADLEGADLHDANLHGANLHDADLRGADLEGADLHDANLHDANLHDANLLSLVGLPSGFVVLVPIATGWKLHVGCWKGSPNDLRVLIAKDYDWPGAVDRTEMDERRPMLTAVADLADAWIATHSGQLAAVVEKWGEK